MYGSLTVSPCESSPMHLKLRKGINSEGKELLYDSKLFRALKMKTDYEKQQNDLTMLNDGTINQCRVKFKA